MPYLYGGSSREGAIFETVFHSVPIEAPDKFVDLGDFAHRAYGQIVPTDAGPGQAERHVAAQPAF